MSGSVRLAYLANDLVDPAVARRVETLLAGGAEVTLAGFRRSDRAVSSVAGVAALDLGRTYDGQMPRRALRVATQSLNHRHLRVLFRRADVLLARNLDNLLVGLAARFWAGSKIPVVYECLDVNRGLVGEQAAKRTLRRLDAYALSRCAGLLVSSPAFLTQYFNRLGVQLPPVILAENKLRPNTGPRPAGPGVPLETPWRIGWFGNLRCTRSFKCLHDLARRWPGAVEIVLAGRPTTQVAALIEQHLPCNGMRFHGLYTLDDLPALYGQCHFAWAIDYFDPGANSDWLLPNRIYEGGYFHVPAIARSGTATAAWLADRGAGLIIDGLEDLHGVISHLMLDRKPVARLREAMARIPDTDLVWTPPACRELVGKIAHPV